MKTPPFRFLLVLLTLPVVTASAQLISYTDRSQVSLLNSYNASLAISGADAGSNMTPDQARFMTNSPPSTILRTTTSNPAATLDFGAVRNVKTITTTEDSYPSYGFTAATVETSNDNINWTTYAGGMTITSPSVNYSGDNNIVTLNTSVNARYIRLTPTTFQNGPGGNDNRWVFNTLRAFGDTGALAGDTNLSIIANGGFSNAQTLSTIGSVSQVDGLELLAPATSPHTTRSILYSIGNGDGYQIDLGQNFTLDRGKMVLEQLTATSSDPIVLTLSGSTDGTNFSPLTTYSWTSNVNLDFIDLSFLPTNIRYLDTVFSSNLSSDIRVSEVSFYQTNPVPEPQTWALAALGASAVLFRLRRKQRTA